MNPFDTVTFESEVGDITYTWGGTILAVYTNADNEEMALVSPLSGGDVVEMKQTDLTVL